MSSNEDSNSQFGAYYNASMPVSRRFDGEKNRQAATNGSSNAPEKTDHLTAVHVLAHPGCLSSLKDHHIPQLVPNDGPYWTTPPPSPHASDGDEQVIAVPALGYLQNASLPNTVHLQGFPVESDKDANGEGKTSTATKSSRPEEEGNLEHDSESSLRRKSSKKQGLRSQKVARRFASLG